MNLSNVKKYLIDYFGRNPFDYSKYDRSADPDDPLYILSSSCATNDIRMEISEGETYIDTETGMKCVEYPNGTVVCTNSDCENNANENNPEKVCSTTCGPDGTCQIEYNGAKQIRYPDGTNIITYFNLICT